MDNIFAFIIGIITALAGGIFWKVWQLKEPYNPKAEEKKEALKNEIKETPAADLLDAAPNAADLHAAADGISGKAKQRLRDRTRKKLSGLDGIGDPPGSGN